MTQPASDQMRNTLAALIRDGDAVLKSRYETAWGGLAVDRELADPWATKLLEVLRAAFGERSDIYRAAKIQSDQLFKYEPASALCRTAQAAIEVWDVDLARASQPATSVVNHHGDVIMGSTFTTTITSSTVGAIATGDGAVATGTVIVHQGTLTQAQHLEHIKAAKKALIDDEERLGAGLHKVLEKFLKLAREVQVEPKAISEVQAELAGVLDRVWVEQNAMTLPEGLQVVEALAKNTSMIEVVKKLGGA